MESASLANIDIFKFVPEAQHNPREKRDAFDKCCADYVLLKMLEEGLHTDITLVAQGGSVKAHRSVLAGVSPVFDAMFQHNMKEQLTSTVNIPDMTIDGLQLFLLVLYTTNEHVGSMQELVSAAIDKPFGEFWGAVHKYQVVTRLEQELLCALERNLTPHNCWDYLNGSLQVSKASSVCCKYILDNYDAVIESESVLKEMRHNPQQVQSIIKMAMKQHKSLDDKTEGGKPEALRFRSSYCRR